jgi:hypothetical protein
MNYFHGQLISERDLQNEQAYFREKLRHMHRCLHGYGVLCGMTVEPVPPPEDCFAEDSKDRKDIRRQLARLEQDIEALKEKASTAEDKETQDKLENAAAELAKKREALRRKLEELDQSRPNQDRDSCHSHSQPVHLVKITCGAAIDCNGDDVILNKPAKVDVAALLKPSERNKLALGRPLTVYLSICYQECGREPTRPFALDNCATTTSCQNTRIVEGARIVASLEPPAEDLRCDPCCTPCEDACLLLAAIEVIADEPITAEDIDQSVRRRFGLYEPTVITGISWKHGMTYTPQTANLILGTRDEHGGIDIAFSRPVHVNTLKPGVIELLRITGGRGLSGVIASMEGTFVDLPDQGTVERVRYRDTTGETVQPRDRILIVVRGPFILDCCCRPVDALHVGGRVPILDNADEAAEVARKEESSQEILETCKHPPRGPVPWTTAGSGNFESWFLVAEE